MSPEALASFPFMKYSECPNYRGLLLQLSLVLYFRVSHDSETLRFCRASGDMASSKDEEGVAKHL
jgi:hypothetical protein